MSITITIPVQIDRALTPNGRAHWAVKRAAREDVQKATQAACTNARLERLTQPLPIVLDFLIAHGKGRKVLDDDNAIAAMKPIRDQIARQIGMDDRQMRTGTMVQIRDESGAGYVQVTIQQEAPDA